jgi:hypothetical protein
VDELIGQMSKMSSGGVWGMAGAGLVLILFIIGQIMLKSMANEMAKKEQARKQGQDQAANPAQNQAADSDAGKAKNEIDKILEGEK